MYINEITSDGSFGSGLNLVGGKSGFQYICQQGIRVSLCNMAWSCSQNFEGKCRYQKINFSVGDIIEAPHKGYIYFTS